MSTETSPSHSDILEQWMLLKSRTAAEIPTEESQFEHLFEGSSTLSERLEMRRVVMKMEMASGNFMARCLLKALKEARRLGAIGYRASLECEYLSVKINIMLDWIEIISRTKAAGDREEVSIMHKIPRSGFAHFLKDRRARDVSLTDLII